MEAMDCAVDMELPVLLLAIVAVSWVLLIVEGANVDAIEVAEVGETNDVS